MRQCSASFDCFPFLEKKNTNRSIKRRKNYHLHYRVRPKIVRFFFPPCAYRSYVCNLIDIYICFDLFFPHHYFLLLFLFGFFIHSFDFCSLLANSPPFSLSSFFFLLSLLSSFSLSFVPTHKRIDWKMWKQWQINMRFEKDDYFKFALSCLLDVPIRRLCDESMRMQMWQRSFCHE